MLVDLEIEFWHNRNLTTNVHGNNNHEASEQSRRTAEEERERERIREQENQELRRRYRLRFEQERDRYRFPYPRVSRGSSTRSCRRRRRRSYDEKTEVGYGFEEGEEIEEQEQQQEREEEEEEEEYNEKMPRGQRYEALPQRPQSPIILSPIPQPGAPNYNYNYNSGVPTSISSAAPSIISIPNSPPPSFHTHSSPGTPRPSQAQLRGGHIGSNHHHHGGSSGVEELWGVAPSTIEGETMDGRSGMGSSNDYLATIKGLKQRVEWLEESMGRMLLEREKSPPYPYAKEDRTNCCVSFTDASADVEQAFLSRGTNCCVSFSGASSATRRKERRIIAGAMLLLILIVAVTIMVVATARAGKVNRAVNAGVERVAKYLE